MGAAASICRSPRRTACFTGDIELLKRVLIVLSVLFLVLLLAVGYGAFAVYRSATVVPEFYAEARVVAEPEIGAARFTNEVEPILGLLDDPSGLAAEAPEGLHPVGDAADEKTAGEAVASEDISGAQNAEYAEGDFASDPAEPPSDGDEARTAVIRDRDLNAFLAAKLADEELGAFQDPRFAFTAETAKLGVLLKLPRYEGVATAELVPVVVDENTMELHLLDVRVGRIATPIRQLLADATVNGDLPDWISLELQLDPPRAVFDWSKLEGFNAGVTGAELAEGTLTITVIPSDDPAADESSIDDDAAAASEQTPE